MDTLGPEKQFVIRTKVSTTQRLFYMHSCLVLQKQSVIERFSLLREFVIRGSTVYLFVRFTHVVEGFSKIFLILVHNHRYYYCRPIGAEVKKL